MPDSDSRDGFFYLPLTPMIDSYIICEPVHSISYKIVCAPSEDSVQPAHPKYIAACKYLEFIYHKCLGIKYIHRLHLNTSKEDLGFL